jgi:hypothetical protein
MHSDLHIHLGRELAPVLDLPAADTQTPDPHGSGEATIALRLAHADERGAIDRLAHLDEAPAPAGDVLLALVDGEPVAALSLVDGGVVADPFAPTADVVDLLRVRAKRLGAPGRAARRRRWRRGATLRPRAA